jgi:CRP-like cAMP-binding protein
MLGSFQIIETHEAAESLVKNFSYPNDQVGKWFFVFIDPCQSPDYVQKIMLDATLSTDGIAPNPVVLFKGIADYGAKYGVFYKLKDYGEKFAVEDALWKNILICLHNAGIKFVIQDQDLSLLDKSVKTLAPIQASEVISQIKLFSSLSPEEKILMNGKLQKEFVPATTTILKQSGVVDNVYFIVEGVVGIYAQDDILYSHSIETGLLGAGEIFGEFALLVGIPYQVNFIAKTDTILYIIAKEDIANLLTESDQLVNIWSRYLVERKSALASKPIDEAKQRADYEKYQRLICQEFNLNNQ